MNVIGDTQVETDETLFVNLTNATNATIAVAQGLELDELWSFVLKKARKRWIWIALYRQTRQVVAYIVGDRSEKTCRRLREAIPEAFRRGHCYTDFWGTVNLTSRTDRTDERK